MYSAVDTQRVYAGCQDGGIYEWQYGTTVPQSLMPLRDLPVGRHLKQTIE